MQHPQKLDILVAAFLLLVCGILLGAGVMSLFLGETPRAAAMAGVLIGSVGGCAASAFLSSVLFKD